LGIIPVCLSILRHCKTSSGSVVFLLYTIFFTTTILTYRAKYEGFINALQKNGEKWKEDIVRSFDEHEQLVQKIIDESSLSQLNEQYIQDIISTFFNNNN
jgi:hypothetical protein